MMKMFKKLMCAVMCVAMVLGCFALVGCADKRKNKVILWGAAQDKAMLEEMVKDFTAKNTELLGKVKIEVGSVEESDAKTAIINDIKAAADVFAFVDDQMLELVDKSALFDLTSSKGSKDVTAALTAGSVAASKMGDKLYAYPSSSESFFLYYDKSVYTAEDVKTLEGMLAKKNANALGIAAKDGFYANMFFAAAGCTLYGADGRDSSNCTWNNAAGKKAADYMTTIKQKGVVPYDQYSMATSKFVAKETAAVITGSWEYATFKKTYGENLGITVLPKVTFAGDAEASQLRPFRGYKMYGVKSTTKYPEISIALAQFMVSKESQLTRFNERAFTPTNTSLSLDVSVLANPTVKVDIESAAIAVPKPGHKTAGSYWEPAGNLSYNLMDGKILSANIQAQLDKFVTDIIVKKA